MCMEHRIGTITEVGTFDVSVSTGAIFLASKLNWVASVISIYQTAIKALVYMQDFTRN